jgi:uncharacterized protein YjiS (DUF1127 family)
MSTIDLHPPAETYASWRPHHRGQRSQLPLVALIASWIDRARQRRALAALDDHMLRDIGVTRLEAAREYEKPFWR